MVLIERIMTKNAQAEQLLQNFLRLTESNQQYVLGIAKGLKHAQEKLEEVSEKRPALLKTKKL